MNRRTVLATALAAGLSVALSIAPSHAQAPSSLEQIRQSGVLRIGVTPAIPWFYKDPASQEWHGVGVRYGEQLAADLGVRLQPVETTWANSVAALQSGQIDVMFVLDATEERRKALDFPDSPIFYYALGILAQDNLDITNWSDLDKPGVRVGVTLGTSNDRIVSNLLKQAEISRFANNDEAIAAFASRRVDAVAQFHPALTAQYARLKLGKVILPKPIDPVATSAGLRKSDDPAWRNWVDARAAAYYEQGLPQRFFEEYLRSVEIDPASIPGLTKEAWR